MVCHSSRNSIAFFPCSLEVSRVVCLHYLSVPSANRNLGEIFVESYCSIRHVASNTWVCHLCANSVSILQISVAQCILCSRCISFRFAMPNVSQIGGDSCGVTLRDLHHCDQHFGGLVLCQFRVYPLHQLGSRSFAFHLSLMYRRQ